MSDKINVLFPVETINREIDFRLFLAVLYAAPNRKVWIGQHDVVHSLVPKMRGGIYVGKNIFHTSPPADLKYYNSIKNNGFKIIYLHEEGAFFPGDEENWIKILDSQYDVNVFQEDDYLCTWGEFQAKYNQSIAPKLEGKIRVTGHPRFDLYKPKFQEFYKADIDRINSKYGKYILFNSNFSLANHGKGVDFIFSEAGGYYVNDPEKRLYRIGSYTQTAVSLMKMISVIHNIAVTFPDINIIVRPHPSESHDFHKTIFKGVKNIFVEHEGPVAPWLLGSQLVLHDGCTTAVEASLAGVPVVNYKPSEAPKYDQYIPNLIGEQCISEEEVMHVIRQVLEGNLPVFDTATLPDKALDMFYNFSGDSFKALIEVMQEAEGTLKIEFQNVSFLDINKMLAKTKGLERIKKTVYPFIPSKLHDMNYHKTKFYGFDEAIIQKKIELIQEVCKKKVNLKIISNSLLTIE